MTDSLRSFQLLLGSLDEQRALVFLPATTIPDGDVHYAVDASGIRHLLVPVAPDHAFTEQHGETLQISRGVSPRGTGPVIDLSCGSEALAGVFSIMVDDIVTKITREPTRAASILFATVSDWRKLLQSAHSLSEEASRGLFGELVVLERLAKRNSHYSLDCWTGPLGDPHDFSGARADLEVKTSMAEGQEVAITSLDQLDSVGDKTLALVRVRVRKSSSGRRITDLMEALIELGCDRNQLVQTAAEAGFIHGVSNDPQAYEVAEVLGWKVTSSFPGLRRDDLPEVRREAITRVRYTVDLVNADGALGERGLDEYLQRLVSP